MTALYYLGPVIANDEESFIFLSWWYSINFFSNFSGLCKIVFTPVVGRGGLCDMEYLLIRGEVWYTIGK